MGREAGLPSGAFPDAGRHRFGQLRLPSIVRRGTKIGFRRKGGKMRRPLFLIGLTVALLAGTTGIAGADPVHHFGTFEVECGADVVELTEKPAQGSAQIVAINGEPSTGVVVLMGVVVTVEGVGIVEEFHKPYTTRQAVTVCTQHPEPGVTVVTEFLITPR